MAPALIGVLALEGDGWAPAARVVLGVWVAVLAPGFAAPRWSGMVGTLLALQLGAGEVHGVVSGIIAAWPCRFPAASTSCHTVARSIQNRTPDLVMRTPR